SQILALSQNAYTQPLKQITVLTKRNPSNVDGLEQKFGNRNRKSLLKPQHLH
ncbi:7003_t:CDS:1, partial [Dentiscutata heterogama]